MPIEQSSAYRAGQEIRERFDPNGSAQPFIDAFSSFQPVVGPVERVTVNAVRSGIMNTPVIGDFIRGASRDPSNVTLPNGQQVEESSLPLTNRNDNR